MSAYGALAAWYDALTRDVDYAAFADFYEQCFQQGAARATPCWIFAAAPARSRA